MNYQTPRIYRKGAYIFQPDDRAMSPDGNMYFTPENPAYSDDFSTAPYGAQHTFIHELGHIAQAQRGECVRCAAFDDYDYWPLVTTSPFTRLNLEQQAEMVADYFLLKEYGRQYPSSNGNVSPPKLLDFERYVPFVYPDGNQE